MNRRKTLGTVPFIFLCIAWIMQQSAPAQDSLPLTKLKSCIVNYENGEYQKTADTLEKLAPTLSNADEQMKAYKYLAFSYGMLNRIEKSKAVFQLVVKKFPHMTIDTLETPPNIAIIFRQVKLEKKIETMNAPRPKAVVVVQKKNVTAPVIVLSCSILCAGASADLFYYGNQQHQKYKSVNTPDQNLLNHYYNRYQEATIAAAVSAGVAVVLLPVSIYLFSKKDNSQKRLSLSIESGFPSVVFNF